MARRKSKILNMRIEPELKDAAEKAAADDRRSLTSWVEKLMVDFLKREGYLEAD